jgi:hypothetical protein
MTIGWTTAQAAQADLEYPWGWVITGLGTDGNFEYIGVTTDSILTTAVNSQTLIEYYDTQDNHTWENHYAVQKNRDHLKLFVLNHPAISTGIGSTDPRLVGINSAIGIASAYLATEIT